MNPRPPGRSVTRTLFASPIFWAMFGAYLAGRVTPLDAPDWIGPASGLACAIAAGLIERWYVTARAKVIVTQGIVDAVELRGDLFRLCPEHGDGCGVTCTSRR